MELFKANVVTMNTPPNEIYYQLKGLWEQLYPDHADMSQEGPEALSKGLINVNTGKSVSHFSTFVVGDNFKVVPLISGLHYLEEHIRAGKRVSHIRY